MTRTALRAYAVGAILAVAAPSTAHATWSIIAVDRATGRIVIASATCVSQTSLERFPSKGLMDIQAVVVPGVGIAAAQAGVDPTRANQTLIARELRAGTHPAVIIQRLMADSSIQNRQFGIVDLRGRFAGFSGSRNGAASLAIQGEASGADIFYSIQGNILASNAVVQNAVRAFESATGTITDRVMAAMEAADAAGGDRRCTCTTNPVPTTTAACTRRTAHVAYILAADSSAAAADAATRGSYALFIDVTDRNIRPDENPSPVVTLRMRYDAWRRSGSGPGDPRATSPAASPR